MRRPFDRSRTRGCGRSARETRVSVRLVEAEHERAPDAVLVHHPEQLVGRPRIPSMSSPRWVCASKISTSDGNSRRTSSRQVARSSCARSSASIKVCQASLCRADVDRARADQSAGQLLLHDVRRPAGSSRAGEERGRVAAGMRAIRARRRPRTRRSSRAAGRDTSRATRRSPPARALLRPRRGASPVASPCVLAPSHADPRRGKRGGRSP